LGLAPVDFVGCSTSLFKIFLAVAPSLFVYSFLAVVGVASVLSFHASGNHSNRERLLYIIILLACLAIFHWVLWNTRKVFLSQFNRIQPGMTIEQVDSIFRPCSLDISEQPINKTLRSYRHSRLPRFDSDVGIVHFSVEIVTKKEFLFDEAWRQRKPYVGCAWIHPLVDVSDRSHGGIAAV
jgi:hypothetical protein